jgi:hypothetical protein
VSKIKKLPTLIKCGELILFILFRHMLYQCCQDSRVIDIPTRLYFMIQDSELERLCIEGSGCQISNVWYASYAETHGVILTPEEAEAIDEQEYEEDDLTTQVDLNLESDYWE